MDASVCIRRAGVADAAAIEDVLRRSWHALMRDAFPQAVPPAVSIDESVCAWRASLANAARIERRVWVVEQGGSIVGVSQTSPTRDDDDDAARTNMLRLLYIQPESWGLGLGRALMTHSADDARRRGWHELALWVLEGNARARRFYERAGLLPDGARKSVERGGVHLDDLRYRMQLANPQGYLRAR